MLWHGLLTVPPASTEVMLVMLWHGLLTVPPASTEGLLMLWHGLLTVPPASTEVMLWHGLLTVPPAWSPLQPYQSRCVIGSSVMARCGTRSEETFGRESGTVRRPCHSVGAPKRIARPGEPAT